MRRWDRPRAFLMRWSVGCLLQVPNISFNCRGSIISRWHIGMAGHYKLFLLLSVLAHWLIRQNREEYRIPDSTRRAIKEQENQVDR